MMNDSKYDIVPQPTPHGEIVLYQLDETVCLEVHLEEDTVWLTQKQIIELFQSSKANISEHIKNIYEQGELVYSATVRNFRTVQKEGNRMVSRIRYRQHGRTIDVKEYNSRFHDRFLILDDALYHFGASFKDLGKRLFAFELMGLDKNVILSQL